MSTVIGLNLIDLGLCIDPAVIMWLYHYVSYSRSFKVNCRVTSFEKICCIHINKILPSKIQFVGKLYIDKLIAL